MQIPLTKFCGRRECSVDVKDKTIVCEYITPENQCSHPSLPPTALLTCSPYEEVEYYYAQFYNKDYSNPRPHSIKCTPPELELELIARNCRSVHNFMTYIQSLNTAR